MGRGLRVIGFPHVSSFTDRHGKVRYRYRRKGRKAVYLHGTPGSPEFAAAYEAACSGDEGRIIPGAGRAIPGSIEALVIAIYSSAEWRQKAKSTQATYRGIMEGLRRKHGKLAVKGLRPHHVLRMRDMKAETPSAANNLVKVLSYMMGFAVARGWRADSPVLGIKPLKVDSEGFAVWTEADISRFEAFWPVGTRQRLAFDLLLYTAQRSGDVRRIGRQHLSDDGILVRQQKTKAMLELPIHPQLARSLATVPSDQLLFLTTGAGVGYTAGGFGNWFRSACRAAGLAERSAHGLRKSAATRLADAGCSEAQIKAVTGHQTSKEVARYTKARDQKRLAQDAMAMIGGPKREQELSNPAAELAKSATK